MGEIEFLSFKTRLSLVCGSYFKQNMFEKIVSVGLWVLAGWLLYIMKTYLFLLFLFSSSFITEKFSGSNTLVVSEGKPTSNKNAFQFCILYLFVLLSVVFEILLCISHFNALSFPMQSWNVYYAAKFSAYFFAVNQLVPISTYGEKHAQSCRTK